MARSKREGLTKMQWAARAVALRRAACFLEDTVAVNPSSGGELREACKSLADGFRQRAESCSSKASGA